MDLLEKLFRSTLTETTSAGISRILEDSSSQGARLPGNFVVIPMQKGGCGHLATNGDEMGELNRYVCIDEHLQLDPR